MIDSQATLSICGVVCKRFRDDKQARFLDNEEHMTPLSDGSAVTADEHDCRRLIPVGALNEYVRKKKGAEARDFAATWEEAKLLETERWSELPAGGPDITDDGTMADRLHHSSEAARFAFEATRPKKRRTAAFLAYAAALSKDVGIDLVRDRDRSEDTCRPEPVILSPTTESPHSCVDEKDENDIEETPMVMPSPSNNKDADKRDAQPSESEKVMQKVRPTSTSAEGEKSDAERNPAEGRGKATGKVQDTEKKVVPAEMVKTTPNTASTMVTAAMFMRSFEKRFDEPFDSLLAQVTTARPDVLRSLPYLAPDHALHGEFLAIRRRHLALTRQNRRHNNMDRSQTCETPRGAPKKTRRGERRQKRHSIAATNENNDETEAETMTGEKREKVAEAVAADNEDSEKAASRDAMFSSLLESVNALQRLPVYIANVPLFPSPTEQNSGKQNLSNNAATDAREEPHENQQQQRKPEEGTATTKQIKGPDPASRSIPFSSEATAQSVVQSFFKELERELPEVCITPNKPDVPKKHETKNDDILVDAFLSCLTTNETTEPTDNVTEECPASTGAVVPSGIPSGHPCGSGSTLGTTDVQHGRPLAVNRQVVVVHAAALAVASVVSLTLESPDAESGGSVGISEDTAPESAETSSHTKPRVGVLADSSTHTSGEADHDTCQAPLDGKSAAQIAIDAHGKSAQEKVGPLAADPVHTPAKTPKDNSAEDTPQPPADDPPKATVAVPADSNLAEAISKTPPQPSADDPAQATDEVSADNSAETRKLPADTSVQVIAEAQSSGNPAAEAQAVITEQPETRAPADSSSQTPADHSPQSPQAHSSQAGNTTQAPPEVQADNVTQTLVVASADNSQTLAEADNSATPTPVSAPEDTSQMSEGEATRISQAQEEAPATVYVPATAAQPAVGTTASVTTQMESSDIPRADAAAVVAASISTSTGLVESVTNLEKKNDGATLPPTGNIPAESVPRNDSKALESEIRKESLSKPLQAPNEAVHLAIGEPNATNTSPSFSPTDVINNESSLAKATTNEPGAQDTDDTIMCDVQARNAPPVPLVTSGNKDDGGRVAAASSPAVGNENNPETNANLIEQEHTATKVGDSLTDDSHLPTSKHADDAVPQSQKHEDTSAQASNTAATANRSCNFEEAGMPYVHVSRWDQPSTESRDVLPKYISKTKSNDTYPDPEFEDSFVVRKFVECSPKKSEGRKQQAAKTRNERTLVTEDVIVAAPRPAAEEAVVVKPVLTKEQQLFRVLYKTAEMVSVAGQSAERVLVETLRELCDDPGLAYPPLFAFLDPANTYHDAYRSTIGGLKATRDMERHGVIQVVADAVSRGHQDGIDLLKPLREHAQCDWRLSFVLEDVVGYDSFVQSVERIQQHASQRSDKRPSSDDDRSSQHAKRQCTSSPQKAPEALQQIPPFVDAPAPDEKGSDEDDSTSFNSSLTNMSVPSSPEASDEASPELNQVPDLTDAPDETLLDKQNAESGERTRAAQKIKSKVPLAIEKARASFEQASQVVLTSWYDAFAPLHLQRRRLADSVGKGLSPEALRDLRRKAATAHDTGGKGNLLADYDDTHYRKRQEHAQEQEQRAARVSPPPLNATLELTPETQALFDDNPVLVRVAHLVVAKGVQFEEKLRERGKFEFVQPESERYDSYKAILQVLLDTQKKEDEQSVKDEEVSAVSPQTQAMFDDNPAIVRVARLVVAQGSEFEERLRQNKDRFTFVQPDDDRHEIYQAILQALMQTGTGAAADEPTPQENHLEQQKGAEPACEIIPTTVPTDLQDSDSVSRDAGARPQEENVVQQVSAEPADESIPATPACEAIATPSSNTVITDPQDSVSVPCKAVISQNDAQNTIGNKQTSEPVASTGGHPSEISKEVHDAPLPLMKERRKMSSPPPSCEGESSSHSQAGSLFENHPVMVRVARLVAEKGPQFECTLRERNTFDFVHSDHADHALYKEILSAVGVVRAPVLKRANSSELPDTSKRRKVEIESSPEREEHQGFLLDY
ncbi:hypothetical protein DIPPA_59261 [Diplonema papillatum]|nr:hypothetical protein DIPPA_59261 [Diplonema papillatum]